MITAVQFNFQGTSQPPRYHHSCWALPFSTGADIILRECRVTLYFPPLINEFFQTFIKNLIFEASQQFIAYLKMIYCYIKKVLKIIRNDFREKKELITF